MTIRENKFPVKDLIVPQHVLVSVFDKSGLTTLLEDLHTCNPKVVFYSTGGTGKVIREFLGQSTATNYVSVEDFTGAREMEGGLVKTLHPKVHAGLLAERGNPAHQQYLAAMCGVYFDMFVGNLYPFSDVVAKPDSTAEQARINIDIGGPTMIMSAAKNWHSVAVVSRPGQYGRIGYVLGRRSGVSLTLRFALAQEAMQLIADYRSMNARYFNRLDFRIDVLPGLQVEA